MSSASLMERLIIYVFIYLNLSWQESWSIPMFQFSYLLLVKISFHEVSSRKRRRQKSIVTIWKKRGGGVVGVEEEAIHEGNPHWYSSKFQFFITNQAKPALKPFAFNRQININRYYLTRKLTTLKINPLTSILIVHLANYKYNQKAN